MESNRRSWRVDAPLDPARGFWGRALRDERFATLVGAVVVGIVGGGASLVFRWLVWGAWAVFSTVQSLDAPWRVALILVVPAVGGLIVGRLSRDPDPDTHGMVGIKAAFITSGGVLRTRLALLRGLACAITTSTGGSAGCEGPIARIAGAVGSWIAQRLGLHGSRLQVLVACGVSASIAGLFNTPIAGVVFATEVVLGGYAIRSLAPLVVSSASAIGVVRIAMGSRPAFRAPLFVLQGPADLVVHLIVGTACGVVAAGFIHLLDRSQNLKLPVPAALRPAVGGLAVGAIALGVPGVFGVGYPAMDTLFTAPPGVIAIALLAGAKLAATVITLATRGAGGIYAPSLVTGGALGWLVGHAANLIVPGTFAAPGAFAAAGMAAMVAGVTHAPFTGAVLLVESTRNYQAVLPGVIAAVAASVVSSTIRDDSAYGMALGKQGLREPSERHTTALQPGTIQPLVNPDRDIVDPKLPLRELVRRLPSLRKQVLVVTGDRVEGVLPIRKLTGMTVAGTPEHLTVSSAAIDTGNLAPEDSVARALVQFMRHDAPAMPVVDGSGALLGLVWRADLMDCCAHDLLREYLRLGGAALPSIADDSRKPLSHDVAALPVPRRMVGRSLRDIDLGKRFGIVCVGLRRATETGSFVAIQLSPSLTLRADDVLIVTGNATDIERLSRLEEQPGSTAQPRDDGD